MYHALHGLVLREVKFKEADKMLTVLTQEEGKISVRARGALRKSCRFAAASQQLVYSEMTVFENRGRFTLEEASVIEDFSALRENIVSFALGVYFAELMEVLSDEDSPDPEMLRLGLNSLFALSRQMYPTRLIKAAFELRAMCIAGYAPPLDGCSDCGRTDMPFGLLNMAEGTLLCPECAAETGTAGERVDADILAAMRHITGADLKRIFSFALREEQTAVQLGRLTERYTLLLLDRGFGALDYYKKLL